jgi:hypothetical protein
MKNEPENSWLDAMATLTNDGKDFFLTDEQLKMIAAYLNQPSSKSAIDKDFDPPQSGPKGIPMLTARQLFPTEMAKEALNAKTSEPRRCQILDAFRRGYEVMKELDVPAYRILFVQYDYTPKIQIWFD